MTAFPLYPTAETTPESPSKNDMPPARLHWTALAACVLAFVTLFLSEGSSFILPVFIIALIASPFARFRLSDNIAPAWMLRILFWGAIVALNQMRPDDPNNSFFDFKLNWAGELLASELVIQVWKRRPEGGAGGVVTLLLSGLVFMIACDVSEDPRRFPYISYFAPAYMLFVILSLRHFVSNRQNQSYESGRQGAGYNGTVQISEERRVARTRRAAYGVAVALALGLGMGAHRTFRAYRQELTYWGMRFLNERQDRRSVGLSTSPQLGPTDNLKGSVERALRIEGDIGDPHWRVLSFSRYSQGGWSPARNTRDYATLPTGNGEKKAARTPHTRVTVTRLAQNFGLLCAPLGAISLDPLDSGDVNWSPNQGGPLAVQTRAPTRYGLSLARQQENGLTQGLFCASPDKPNPSERARLLEVPKEIDPRVKRLAQTIAAAYMSSQSSQAGKSGSAAENAPNARIEAVTRYLLANYHYSLTYHPAQGGDPLSVFLLNRGAAHCEYFAAAAVILLRCLGLPARYVVGYYAHESGGAGITIIRQRDAHAWAECWVDGQGWSVVDATPGDGRPDALAGPVPAWIRVREWLQDAWSRSLAWLGGPGGGKLALLLGAGAFLALAWQWRKQRRPAGEKSRPFKYASPGEELAALASDFERICRAQGLACPPQATWQEYLESPMSDAAVTASGVRIERAKARAFVSAYNAARFGPEPDKATLDALKSLLAQIETH